MDNVNSQVALTIRHLHEQVRMIKMLQQHLKKIIDPALTEYLDVATIKKQTLVLIADNSSIATHIKLIAPAIIDGMAKLAPQLNITAINCKVKKPVHDGQSTQQKPQIHLSDKTALHINQTAAGIKNKRLKNALEKLSQNTRKT